MATTFAKRMMKAAVGAFVPNRKNAPKNERKAKERLESIGVLGVGRSSTPEEIEQFESKLWEEQDPWVDELAKEWKKILDYCANRQHISWHRDARRWIPKKTVPWRIRSVYNVLSKAVKVRVARLTESKPTINVIAGSTDKEDVDAAEYKESQFWHLWNQLDLHGTIVRCRRWATKCASGFIKVDFDPEAGDECPATKKVIRYKQVPALDPMTQQPLLHPTGEPVTEQVYDGIEEVYVDAKGRELGPVYEMQDDPDNPGEKKRVKLDPPEGTEFYRDGWPTAQVRTPFNIRYDRYVDDVAESWYVQDAQIVRGSDVLATWPDKIGQIREARAATDDDKALQWTGLAQNPMHVEFAGGATESNSHNDEKLLDKEYLVRETWIYPKNRHVREMWGSKGTRIVTVGGKLVELEDLPEWAVRKMNYIQMIDEPEEGNHYGKPFLRDLLPIQDDINRSRSQAAERQAILSRLIFFAPQGHQLNLRLFGGLPAVLLTGRSAQHKPEVLQMNNGNTGALEFYQSSLSAAEDLGNVNPASTGKMPGAGTAAKAIYALQYADERSISETSTLQDIFLKRLAEALDAVCQVEFTDARKVRLVGADRSFMVETEIKPEHQKANVDYFFVPGSMMSRQKEAIKNEVLELQGRGLLQPWEARKFLTTTVPEAFRRSYDLQEAKARSNLEKILDGEATQIQPQPWEDPDVGSAVLEEFMLTKKFELVDDDARKAIMQLWQAYQLSRQMRAAGQPQQPTHDAGTPGGGAAPTPQPQLDGAAPAEGAELLEQQATEAMEAPEPAGVQ
jgi:hypothetical protein